MANDYGELEQMVNDVTSLDTARMTLRWALERLNTIEKEKADLKKNLTIAEETSKRLQAKEGSLKDAYISRSKNLEEKEDFYTKLEATMALLGEGKLDIQQLLKKEAKLDTLRHSLENEYQDKFEELDRSQRSVIERWNGRLLEVESQYAGQLAESQKKYDSLRTELETDYQGRMNALQTSFKSREKELSERVSALEGNVLRSEEKVETRRRELEAEYLAKKKETEENYRKLKNMLEAGQDERLRAMDSDHAAQVRSLEASWLTERERLIEEQRVRDTQFFAAQARIKEIENSLASQQETHHNELLRLITEKETAFRGQLAELEKEKAAKEETVKELVSRLEKKATDWENEKARLEAEFGGRLALMEKSLRERAAGLEREFAGKKEELDNIIAVNREETEKEFNARLLMERQALEAERARLEAAKAASDEAMGSAIGRVRELEAAMAASREEHHKELMERIRASENSFREKLAGFEAEKRAYNDTITGLTGELKEKSAALLQTREKFESDIARISAETAADGDARMAAVRADYEARKAELGREFEARYADRLKAIEIEKGRMNEALAEREKQLEVSYSKAAEMDSAMAELRRSVADEMNRALKTAEAEAKAREAELMADINVLRSELAEKDRVLSLEREKLADELSKASVEAHNRTEERAAALRAEYERRLAGQEALAEENTRGLKALLAEKEASLEKALQERAGAEKELRAAFERRVCDLEEGISAKAALLEADYAGRREKLEADAAARAAVVNSEAAAKMDFERRNWQAERVRFEHTLEETAGHFEEAQKEILGLNAGLRKAAEENAAREAIFNRELMETKANYDRELTYRVKDAVSVQTTHLVEALEAARKKQEDLAADLEARETSIAALRGEATQARREFDERIASCAADAVAARRAEMEQDFKARRAALEEEFSGNNSRLSEENSAMRAEMEKVKKTALETLAARRAEMEEDFRARRAALTDEFAMKNGRLVEENAAMKEALASMSAAAAEANSRSAALSSELMAAATAAAAEKLEMQKAQARELDSAVAGAVAAAMEDMEAKLTHAHAELERVRKEGAAEARRLEEAAAAEKDRMLEEMDRRERYIESADMKIQDLEREMVKYRQSASGELIKQMSEQDERFRVLVASEKSRTGERVKQLEELLSAKEKMLADADKFYRQKQLDLDEMHTELNQRVNKFNEDLFAQKQELGEKEKALNDYRLRLEKDYAVKVAELEQMRAELSRAIMDYKGRK